MPLVSIILSCYNGSRYLDEALKSFKRQQFSDWEMIFVNDGSTDDSLIIADSFAVLDKRIKTVSKENGGLNSARNYGLKFINELSSYIIFSDADDILLPEFLGKLVSNLENDIGAGAAYCRYTLIDSSGNIISSSNTTKRYMPTNLWVNSLKPTVKYTSLFSIISWTHMVEPMTLLRREFFEKYKKWDEINFPKGDTYGESIPLFGEMSLNHKIIFVNEILYNYRRHNDQITKAKIDKKYVENKIDRILKDLAKKKQEYKSAIEQAIFFRNYRLPLFLYLNGSFKHDLRYKPFTAIKSFFSFLLKYLVSVPLLLKYKF